MLATKIRLFGEAGSRPAVGLRFATKLPNASNESGLGHDMTDFFASLLVAKTVQSIRVVGNAGVAILGDPTATVPEQNDLLTFGLSVARAMTTSTELVGEINGRFNAAEDTDPGAREPRRVAFWRPLHARHRPRGCRRADRHDLPRSTSGAQPSDSPGSSTPSGFPERSC